MRYIRFAPAVDGADCVRAVPVVTGAGDRHPSAPAPMINPSEDPRSRSFRFRSIGPASMGGRIDDVAVAESDPNIIYLGYAVGGVWKSVNNGTTFEPVFDTYGSASIGDIAIHPTNPNIVYVGTGEANNRQTSSFGDGIYKTTDGGKTFTHIGLRETQTIARIVIDPRNPDTRLRRRRPAICSGRMRSAASTRRPTAARRGTTSSSSTRTRASPTSRSIPSNTQHPLRRQLPAPAQRLLLQRRRTGQRALEDDRRRQDLDEDHRQRTAAGHLRPHRARRLALEPERRLRADRSRRQDNQPTAAARRRTLAAAVARRRRRRWWPRWCGTTGATTPARQGLRRPRRVQAGGSDISQRHRAPAARSGARRALPVGQQGRELDARQQLQRAADVLQSAPRRSDQRQDRLRRRTARREVARRRQDVRDARRRRRHQSPGHVDQHAIWIDPKNPKHLMHRQRRRPQHQLGSGRDVGLRQHDGHGARLLGQRRHAAAVLRLHRPAGQRQLGRPERDAPPRRHPELRLVRHRRRRRLPDRGRPDRPQHRLHRIAERQHEPVRPADRPGAAASGRAHRGAAAELPRRARERRRRVPRRQAQQGGGGRGGISRRTC